MHYDFVFVVIGDWSHFPLCLLLTIVVYNSLVAITLLIYLFFN